MKIIITSSILCSVFLIISSVLAEKNNTEQPCRHYIEVNMVLDWEKLAALKPFKERVRDCLTSVTEISRPINNVSGNCEYWLKIDNSSIREITNNAFNNLRISGLEILDENNVLFLSECSFNGLPLLQTLKIRPLVHIFNSLSSKKAHQDDSNLHTLEFGSSYRSTFNKILKMFPRLKNLIINHAPSSFISMSTFSSAPSSIKYLEFTHSKMLRILSSAFYHLKGLTNLKFNNTGIKKISPGAFRDLDQLENLSFSTVYPFKITKNVLNEFKNLNTLIMRRCVSDIERNSFFGLKAKFMDLSCNKIVTIKNGIFSGIEVTDLDLSFNEIKRIENGAFADSKIDNLYLWNTGLNASHIAKYAWGLSNTTQIIFDHAYLTNSNQSCPDKSFIYQDNDNKLDSIL